MKYILNVYERNFLSKADFSVFKNTFNVDFQGLIKSLTGASETPSQVGPVFFLYQQKKSQKLKFKGIKL